MAKIMVRSDSFAHEEAIPVQYTCKGEDISPHLSWDAGPEGTQSYVVVCEDPDAPMGMWDHWVLFNLPADVTSLEEGSSRNKPPKPAKRGANSWGKPGYGGPCPPAGTHRYFFRVFALDTVLDLMPGAAKTSVYEAMKGHVLADGELMGACTT